MAYHESRALALKHDTHSALADNSTDLRIDKAVGQPPLQQHLRNLRIVTLILVNFMRIRVGANRQTFSGNSCAPVLVRQNPHCRAGLPRGRIRKPVVARRVRVSGSDDAPSRRSPCGASRPSGFRRRSALRALEKFPSLKELLHADASDTEWLGQVAVAKASLAGHAPRNNDSMPGLGKNRPQCHPLNIARIGRCAGGRQVHGTGIAAHKAGRESDNSEGGRHRGRVERQIEMREVFRQAASNSLNRRGLRLIAQKYQRSLVFPTRSGLGPQSNSLHPSP